jgi:hypothetical protein
LKRFLLVCNKIFSIYFVLVEDISDGSLLTDVLTINEDSKNSLLDSAVNKKINKEVMLTIDSNKINNNNNNCGISSKILKQNIIISI